MQGRYRNTVVVLALISATAASTPRLCGASAAQWA